MQRSTLFIAAFTILAGCLQATAPAETFDVPMAVSVQQNSSGQGSNNGVPSDIDHDEQVLATVFYHRIFTFSVGQNVTAEGLLTWQHGVNDFDLILKKDGDVIVASAGVTSKPEAFNATLSPGNYSVHVYLKTQAVVTDFYHVTVDFEAVDQKGS